MLNCLTYIAFVYWAVATVHTVLPIDVGLCGADPSRGGLGALLHHTFGGSVALDPASWAGYPCESNLLHKIAFILQRPGPTVRHIMAGGGQDEPYVPILFVVPLVFLAYATVRQLTGVRLMSEVAARTMLKLGIAVGCRGVILMQSLADPTKQSLYYKRYSKVEFFIVGWTAYIIEIPVWHEAVVSGGSLAIILLMTFLFPHFFLPEVNPWNVAIQAILATIFGVAHASYQQRRRLRERAAGSARATRGAAPGTRGGRRPPGGSKSTDAYYLGGKELEAEAEAATETEEETACAGTSTAAMAGHATSSMSYTATRSEAAAAAATGTTTTTHETACAAEAAAAAAAELAASSAAPIGGADAAAAAAARSAAPPAAVAITSSLEALRRINAFGRVRPYASPARPCRFSIKVQQAHLADLPADLMAVINSEVLAGSGWQAVSAYAREGCVELVLDLRPLLPTRLPYSGGGAGAGFGGGAFGRADSGDDRRAPSDQDDRDESDGGFGGAAAAAAAAAGADDAGVVLDDAALRELSRSVVSYLQSTGVLQPEREPSVILQLGDRTAMMMWQPASQVWEFSCEAAGGAGAAGSELDEGRDAAEQRSRGGGAAEAPAAAAPSRLLRPAGVPSLERVSPRLAVWPGQGVPLRLTAAVRGPSAEEILVGGGLVVRNGGNLLPYSVLQISGQQAARPATAAAGGLAPPPPQPPLLLVELAISGVPVSGLIRVEARTSTGLLSAPLAVVVDFDSELVSGLEALLAGMDATSADAVLTDYGTWMDVAAAAVATYRDGGERGVRDAAAAASAFGGKDVLTPFAAAATAPAAAAGGLTLSSGAALAILAAPFPPMPSIGHPRDKLRDQAAGSGGRTTATTTTTTAPPPVPAACIVMPLAVSQPALQDALVVVAADLLALCCQAGAADTAVGAVANRLIASVAACDARGPAAAVGALLGAVPTPPTNAGALHLAVAAGSHAVAAVLLTWQERLYGNTNTAGGGASGGGGDLWCSRATCGVTPLHVAAAMTDGGAMAGWALDRYPAAVTAWRTAMSDDGLTPASLAAQLGGRWRLRLWHASPLVQAARRVLVLPAPLRAAAELLWGFEDPVRERRFAAQVVSSQTVAALVLYTAANVIAPLCVLVSALLYGSKGASETLLASTLAFHLPHTVPLLAWLGARTPNSGSSSGSGGSSSGGPPSLLTVSAAAAAATTTRGSAAGAASARSTQPQASAAAGSVPGDRRRRRRRLWGGGGGGVLGAGFGSGSGLRRALVAMHLCRAGAKAATGLGLWPFVLPRSTAVFLSRGGDIALEALARPLLEQLGLPSRLLLSLLDGPATYLMYRGVARSHPGVLPAPLARVLLYQAVLLGTTAAIAAVNRALFLRAERARTASKLLQAAATAAAARDAARRPPPSRSSSASSASSLEGLTAPAPQQPRAVQSQDQDQSDQDNNSSNNNNNMASSGGAQQRPRPAGRKSDDQSHSAGSADCGVADGGRNTTVAAAGPATAAAGGGGGGNCGGGDVWPRRRSVLPSSPGVH